MLVISIKGYCMEFKYTKDSILINNKVLTELDEFVVDFINILRKYCNYVVISGYIPIFFGRTRGTEDVDVFIDYVDKKTFVSFYNDLVKNNYYFLNPEDENGLYEMLTDKLGIRTAKKDTIIPNMEMKFIKDDIDRFTLNNRVKVTVNKKSNLFISPIEVEIPYKLYLGSEKDIEDALYLWDIFQNDLDKKLMNRFMNELNVSGEQYGIKI
jgi:hypothetical protein